MIYKIRDSVDVYLISEQILMFYFINTRKSYEFKASPEVITLIKLIDGKCSCSELMEIYQKVTGKSTTLNAIERVCKYLENLNITCPVSDSHPPFEDRYERQISFLEELNFGSDSGISSQMKISKQCVAIFGVGAVGGDIALLLAMAGVKHFVFIDNGIVTPSNISRHLYYRESSIGQKKVDSLKNEILCIDPSIKITCFPQRLEPQTNLEPLLCNVSFVVNTADEPYIGYTSLKISRFCVRRNIPHYTGGGFDIHLMSTGEIVIPGLTPCADCYSSYFSDILKDWKPLNKKVVDIQNEYGGLSSQSLFSASCGALTILKFFCISSDKQSWNSRGELDFESYKFSFLDAKKNPNCPTCSGVKYEAKN